MFRRQDRYKSIRKRAREGADAVKHAIGLGQPPSPRRADSWREWMHRARIMAREGRYDDAARYYRRAAFRRPDHLPTLFALAAALLRAGEARQALRRFDDILRLNPSHRDAEHGKGLAHHTLGEHDQALRAFRRAAALNGRAWTSWQSIADITDDEAERVDAVQRAADTLLAAASPASAAPALVLECATELIHAGRTDEAGSLIEDKFDLFRDPSTAHSKLASAHYHGGAFELAFNHIERALQTLQSASIPDAPLPSAFKPDQAIEALRDVLGILEDAGARPFLCAGTLLGFLRDGGPLPHDRDVDIGILHTPDQTPDLAAAIRRHPKLLLKRGARPGDRYFALLHRGVGVDLFLYEPHNGHVVCGLSRHPADIQWRFSAFDLFTTEYRGAPYRIPERPERYLEETYGPAWTIPDKGFASVISSPALYEVSPHARAFYSGARARKALLAGEREKAATLIAQSPIPISANVPTNSSQAFGDVPPDPTGKRGSKV